MVRRIPPPALLLFLYGKQVLHYYLPRGRHASQQFNRLLGESQCLPALTFTLIANRQISVALGVVLLKTTPSNRSEWCHELEPY